MTNEARQAAEAMREAAAQKATTFLVYHPHGGGSFRSPSSHEIAAAIRALPLPEATPTFQSRVDAWLLACFGSEIATDKIERNHRFLEEALELVQSCGCSQNEAHQLVDYVFGRDRGDPNQEVGCVMNTLAALCSAHGLDMDSAGETELARVWTNIEIIRAKQAAKPKHSPLPEDPRNEALAKASNALDRAIFFIGEAYREGAWQEDVVSEMHDVSDAINDMKISGILHTRDREGKG